MQDCMLVLSSNATNFTDFEIIKFICRQAWRLEEAKLLWVQSRHEQAIALTKNLLREADDFAATESLLIPQLRTLLGKWQSERR